MDSLMIGSAGGAATFIACAAPELDVLGAHRPWSPPAASLRRPAVPADGPSPCPGGHRLPRQSERAVADVAVRP